MKLEIDSEIKRLDETLDSIRRYLWPRIFIKKDKRT